jgi:acyl carrier protein
VHNDLSTHEPHKLLMTPDEIRAAVIDLLVSIAPDIDAATLRGDTSLREQVELDSVDVMSYVTGLSKRFALHIPERDYPQLFRLDACVRYLAQRLAHRDAVGSR